MHNNFLVERTGKMSKSSGEFPRLQTLVDRGFHPLAYGLMCLQAHYRCELEFTWEGLAAALDAAEAAGDDDRRRCARAAPRMRSGHATAYRAQLDEAVSRRPRTRRKALPVLDEMLGRQDNCRRPTRLRALADFDAVLGLDLATLERAELRVRPADATIDEAEIDAQLAERSDARAAKDFARSDAIRDALAAARGRGDGWRCARLGLAARTPIGHEGIGHEGDR